VPRSSFPDAGAAPNPTLAPSAPAGVARPRAVARRRDLAWRAAPALVAAALAGLYLALDPRSGDFAAHLFRAELFDREGFTIWNGQWYGGHHTPAYSVLFPPLAWVLGPSLAGALSAVAAAALFEPLVRHRFGDAARLGALWFGAATATILFTGRLPFGLGVAIGLGALLALQRSRFGLAVALGAASSLASPVAGLFVALAGIALALASRSRSAALMALAALIPPVVLAAVFPEGGWQPFSFVSFILVPAFVVVAVAILPRRERALRIGLVLYGLATVAAYFVATPMGSNAVRLGELFGGPVLACALAARRPPALRPGLLAAMLVALAAWPVWPAVRDIVRASGDPSVQASYYAPLLKFLESHDGRPARVEIPFTKSHFEAAEVAPRFPLARGWQRQLDVERNGLFYDGGLINQLTYGTWLAEHGVRYVAVADAPLDKSSRLERAVIDKGPPYLVPRWSSRHWRVYEVTLPRALVLPERGTDIRLVSLRPDEVVLDVRSPGEAIVHVTWSPYWRVEGGCVQRAGQWTLVDARRAGRLRMTTTFSPGRAVSRGRRCA
jgi:hypothetical protein